MKNDKLIAELTRNPKYSSEWICIASDLISDYGFSEEELIPFDSDQLKVIFNTAKKYDSDKARKIANPELNSTQMEILLAGYNNDLNDEILNQLVKPEIPYSVSDYVVQAWINGHDMRPYLDYDPDQIYEIYAGLTNGIDISQYADKEKSAVVMGLIRHALECELEVCYDGKSVIINTIRSN